MSYFEEFKIPQGVDESLATDQNSIQSNASPMANRTYEASSVWQCLKLDERAVDTRDSDSAAAMAVWRRVAQKARKKEEEIAEERKAEKEMEEEVEGNGGMGMRGGS